MLFINNSKNDLAFNFDKCYWLINWQCIYNVVLTKTYTGLQPTIHSIRGDHENQYTTKWLWTIRMIKL
jgi:hypothetical protein